MDPQNLFSKARVKSGEELYSKLNEAPGESAEVIETGLPGELNINPEGLLHYQGPVEISAFVGEVTVARNEGSEVYWMTDGSTNYWLDNEGEFRLGDNHRLQQLHKIGKQVLEPQENKEDDLSIEGQQPGLFTSGPLQYIPNKRREKLRSEIENSSDIDMMEYARNLNEDPQETAESMARELNKKLRRGSQYEPRKRKGTKLIF